jgi:uncharacterized protein DUF3325
MNHILPVLITAALTFLALGMQRHQLPALGRKPSRNIRNGSKSAGWILLAFAVPVAVAAYGWPVGVVALFAWLAVTGFALTLCLAYAPRFTPVCTVCMAVLMALISFCN